MGVQKKKLLHRIMALAIAVAVGLSVIVPGGTSAEAATIPADVTKPSANCVFIAMKGKYVSEASAAVKRINQIRYEACKQGVKIDGRKLTLDDYVPMPGEDREPGKVRTTQKPKKDTGDKMGGLDDEEPEEDPAAVEKARKDLGRD